MRSKAKAQDNYEQDDDEEEEDKNDDGQERGYTPMGVKQIDKHFPKKAVYILVSAFQYAHSTSERAASKHTETTTNHAHTQASQRLNFSHGSQRKKNTKHSGVAGAPRVKKHNKQTRFLTL